MPKSSNLLAALALLTVGLAAAAAADSDSEKLAAQAFGRLSADGMSAFEDIHLARLAIFEGRVLEAAKLVTDAKASLASARLDRTAFVTSEAALHPPLHSPVALPRHSDADATPQSWIPIDADLAFGATFDVTPDQAAAMVAARKGLAKGDAVEALHAIKLAAVDVDYTLAVAPLEQSIAAVDQAAGLIDAHDYYAASQALRQAEASIRYDETLDVGHAGGAARKPSK